MNIRAKGKPYVQLFVVCSLIAYTQVTNIAGYEIGRACDQNVTWWPFYLKNCSLTPKDDQPLSVISTVGCAVAIFCLIVTITVYAVLWKFVKGCWSVLHLNWSVCLVLAYIVFLAGVDSTENTVACKIVSVLLHYIFLAVFFIMLCEGIMVLLSVTWMFNTHTLLRALLPSSYCIPLVIVATSVGKTKTEGYGTETSCWISLDSSQGLIWAFVGPVVLVLLVNFIILIKVLIIIQSRRQMRNTTDTHQLWSFVRTTCVLSPLVVITWVFGVVSVNDEDVVFQYLFAIFNSLQGLFIFIFHCICHPQIKDEFRTKLYKQRIRDAESSPDHGTEQPAELPSNAVHDTCEQTEHNEAEPDMRNSFDIHEENTGGLSINYYRASEEGQHKVNPAYDSLYATRSEKNCENVVDDQPVSTSVQARTGIDAIILSTSHLSHLSDQYKVQTVNQSCITDMNTQAAPVRQRSRPSLKEKLLRLSKIFRGDPQKDLEKLEEIYKSVEAVKPEPYNQHSKQNQGRKQHHVRFTDAKCSAHQVYIESSSQMITPAAYTQRELPKS